METVIRSYRGIMNATKNLFELLPEIEDIGRDGNPFMDEADKQFIRLCAQAVSKGTIREHEVTRLLITNRFFTQSNRMVVLSMQALTRGFSFPEKRVHSHNSGNL